MVDSGPASISQSQYAPDNYLYVTVTVCEPGQTICAAIDHVQVSTATSGLRILLTVLQADGIVLDAEADPAKAGNTLAECYPLPQGTAFGEVAAADIEIGGEKASSVPIQILSTPSATPNAANCVDNGWVSSVQTLGANGVIGLSTLAQDCSGNSCVTQYFTCSSTGSCQSNVSAAPPVTSQLTNPATKFAKDNNGLIVELPAVPAAGAPGLTGQLIFGIGTQANNAFSGTTVMLPAEPASGAITTTYTSQKAGSTAVKYTNSWFDTGSDAYFFTDAGIPGCTGGLAGFYCPPQTLSLQATVTSPTTAADTATVSFSVADASALTSTNVVFDTLGSSPPAGYGGSNPFIWGLPFFMGRNVYIGYPSASVTSGGVTVKGPFYAY